LGELEKIYKIVAEDYEVPDYNIFAKTMLNRDERRNFYNELSANPKYELPKFDSFSRTILPDLAALPESVRQKQHERKPVAQQDTTPQQESESPLDAMVANIAGIPHTPTMYQQDDEPEVDAITGASGRDDDIGDVWKTGVKQAVGMPADMLKWFENLIPEMQMPINLDPEDEKLLKEQELKPLSDIAEKIYDYQGSIEAEEPTGEYAKPPESLWGYADPSRIYMTFAHNVPQMGAFMAATLINPYVGFVTMGAAEGGSAVKAIEDYEEQTGIKVDSDYKKLMPAAVGALNGALELVGINKILKAGDVPGLKGKILSALIATGVEGTTEGMQEVNQILGESGYREIEPEEWQRVIESFYAGTILGFAGAGGKTAIEIVKDLPKGKEETVTTEEELTGKEKGTLDYSEVGGSFEESPAGKEAEEALQGEEETEVPETIKKKGFTEKAKERAKKVRQAHKRAEKPPEGRKPTPTETISPEPIPEVGKKVKSEEQTYSVDNLKKIEFNEFEKLYRQAFKENMKYPPDQVGSKIWSERMANFEEANPDWVSQIEEKVTPVTHEATVKDEESVKQLLKDKFAYDESKASATAKIIDKVNDWFAKKTGKSKEELYQENIAEIRKGTEAEGLKMRQLVQKQEKRERGRVNFQEMAGTSTKGEKIVKAVVKIGDKIYRGRNHSEAIEQAIEEGQLVFDEDGYVRDKDGYDMFGSDFADLFETDKGRIINRYEALDEFGSAASEGYALMQDDLNNKVIPDFDNANSTQDAIALGMALKNNPDMIPEVEKRQADLIAKYKDLMAKGKAEESFDYAFPASLYRESLEIAKGEKAGPALEEYGKERGIEPLFQYEHYEPEQKKNFDNWFAGSKVVDEKGEPKVVYSGHYNTFAYGEKYKPSVSESGGFYSTEDPEIASNYALGKYFRAERMDGSQYRFKKGKGLKYSGRIWDVELTDKQKKIIDRMVSEKDENGDPKYEIAEMPKYIEENRKYDRAVDRMAYRGGVYDLESIYKFYEWMGYNIVYDNEDVDTTVPYFLRQEKSRFENIMDKLGVKWQSFDRSQPGVYPLYLSIQNPIDVSKPFPKDVLQGLKNKSKYERSDIQWQQSLKLLVENVENDEKSRQENPNFNPTWPTTIPKKAVGVFNDFGYDGIEDMGGKTVLAGGPHHKVWIAFNPGQIKSATGNIGTFDPTNPSILQQGPKGAVEFLADGRAIVHALENPNASTAIHEFAHVWLNMIQKYGLKYDLGVVLKWAGSKSVTSKTQEKFARGVERYLRTGKAPTPELQRIFEKFKDWLKEIYSTIKGSPIDIKLSPAMKDLFDEMFGGEKTRTIKEVGKKKPTKTRDIKTVGDWVKARMEDMGDVGINPDHLKEHGISQKENFSTFIKYARRKNNLGLDDWIATAIDEQIIKDSENAENDFIEALVEGRPIHRKTEFVEETAEFEREEAEYYYKQAVDEKAIPEDMDIEEFIKMVPLFQENLFEKEFAKDQAKKGIDVFKKTGFKSQEERDEAYKKYQEKLKKKGGQKDIFGEVEQKTLFQEDLFDQDKIQQMKARGIDVDKLRTIVEDFNRIKMAKPTPKSFYTEAVKGKDLSTKASEALKSERVENKGMLVDAIVPITTRLQLIAPILKTKLRQFESTVNRLKNKDRASIEPFLKFTKKFSKEDRIIFDLAAKNRDNQTMQDLARKYGFANEMQAVRNVLDDLHKRASDVGFDLGYLVDYWPRSVKKSDQFLQYLYETESWGVITEAIRQQEELKGTMTSSEKAAFINNLVRGYIPKNITLSKTANMKIRQIELVTPEMNEFYYDTNTALLKYIDQVNEAVEARKFFGKGEDLEKSIGSYIRDLVDNNEIKPVYESEAMGILRARFNYVHSPAGVSTFKNLGYITTMGSFKSAITQIGDLAWAYYNAGSFEATKALGKAVIKKNEITRKDIGIEHIAQEFSDARKLAKVLQNVFKLVGLTKIDAIGKETLINATLERYRKDLKSGKNTQRINEKLKEYFGPEFEQVKADLLAGTKNENTLIFTFNVLSDFQPITLSEMPKFYLTAPKMRFMYMLKTFTIKQLDVFRREGLRDINQGRINKDKPRMARGVRKLVRLSVIFVLANASADLIKDILYGRDPDLEDTIIDNILRLMGMSKYITWYIRENGPVEGVLKMIAPPAPYLTAPIKDINKLYKAISEGKFDDFKFKNIESIQNIPVVGKELYWWYGGGSEKMERRAKREFKDKTLKEYIDNGRTEKEYMDRMRKNYQEQNKDFKKAEYRLKKEFRIYKKYGLDDTKINRLLTGRNTDKAKYLNELRKEMGETKFLDFYIEGKNELKFISNELNRLYKEKYDPKINTKIGRLRLKKLRIKKVRGTLSKTEVYILKSLEKMYK